MIGVKKSNDILNKMAICYDDDIMKILRMEIAIIPNQQKASSRKALSNQVKSCCGHVIVLWDKSYDNARYSQDHLGIKQVEFP